MSGMLIWNSEIHKERRDSNEAQIWAEISQPEFCRFSAIPRKGQTAMKVPDTAVYVAPYEVWATMSEILVHKSSGTRLNCDVLDSCSDAPPVHTAWLRSPSNILHTIDTFQAPLTHGQPKQT